MIARGKGQLQLVQTKVQKQIWGRAPVADVNKMFHCNHFRVTGSLDLCLRELRDMSAPSNDHARFLSQPSINSPKSSLAALFTSYALLIKPHLQGNLVILGSAVLQYAIVNLRLIASEVMGHMIVTQILPSDLTTLTFAPHYIGIHFASLKISVRDFQELYRGRCNDKTNRSAVLNFYLNVLIASTGGVSTSLFFK